MAARGKRRVRVTNLGGNPVEAAGRRWPPRRTLDVELTEREVTALRRRRRLVVTDPAEQAEQQAEPEPEQ